MFSSFWRPVALSFLYRPIFASTPGRRCRPSSLPHRPRLCVTSLAATADGIEQRITPAADAREALVVDAIEARADSPAERLRRHAVPHRPPWSEDKPVYAQAEVLPSAAPRIAWQMAKENPQRGSSVPSMAISPSPAIHPRWCLAGAARW